MAESSKHIKSKQGLSETDLIKGCVRQDMNCQKILFDYYSSKFYSICLRYANDGMEAEDMLQEAFVRIFNNIHQFKFEGSFEGWMRRVVVNVSLKFLQKKKIKFSTSDESEYAQNKSLEPDAYTELNEEDILKLINELPTGYRIVFNLNVIEGYNHDEIAQMLNIQASTSRSQLVKARKMLQQRIIQIQKVAV